MSRRWPKGRYAGEVNGKRPPVRERKTAKGEARPFGQDGRFTLEAAPRFFTEAEMAHWESRPRRYMYSSQTGYLNDLDDWEEAVRALGTEADS